MKEVLDIGVVVATVLLMLAVGIEMDRRSIREVLGLGARLPAVWIAQTLVPPIIALLLTWLLPLPPHIAAGLLLLAACPVGDIANAYTALARGPVELLPTATDETLGGEKWGLGPTFVGLKQEGPWTYGLLANHVWSVAGDDDRADINATFVQPFVSYITKTKTTLTLNTESTYDWNAGEWSVPVNALVSQLLKVGRFPVQVGVGARYWAESTDNGPEDWGVRAVLTFLFPK